MKKFLSVFLSVLMLVTVLTPAMSASAADEALLPDDAVILIPETATAQESAAANRLRDLIADISGVTHEVMTANTAGAYEIAVGALGKSGADLSGKPDGSYVIKSYDGGVAIEGAGVRGNIYGVYDFIRQCGGGRYYISSEFSKSRDSILLPENADKDRPRTCRTSFPSTRSCRASRPASPCAYRRYSHLLSYQPCNA